MMKPNFSLMTLLDNLGLYRYSWALRRFHLPVSPEALVLEVGSGGNPYPRSNVLLDAYETTRERHWAPLTSDRPTVLGYVEDLPFKDKSFDYVVAAHVLEHSTNPEKFISELQRVARAGYIEVPDAFLERVNPYKDHRLEITCRNEKLVIRKKKGWRHDEETVELYEDRVKRVLTQDLIPRHPFEFHVRYFWENKISYQIVNPEVDCCWNAPVDDRSPAVPSLPQKLRTISRDSLRNFFSQRKRNLSLDILHLLKCNNCHSSLLENKDSIIRCNNCSYEYPVRGKVFAMNEGTNVNAQE